METATEKKPRVKRAPKERGVSQLLNGAKVTLEELLRVVERAIQSLRQENFRIQKKAEQVQTILQQNFDIRGQIRRGWLGIPEPDRKTLEEAGFQGPRKDKT